MLPVHGDNVSNNFNWNSIRQAPQVQLIIFRKVPCFTCDTRAIWMRWSASLANVLWIKVIWSWIGYFVCTCIPSKIWSKRRLRVYPVADKYGLWAWSHVCLRFGVPYNKAGKLWVLIFIFYVFLRLPIRKSSKPFIFVIKGSWIHQIIDYGNLQGFAYYKYVESQDTNIVR